MSRYIMPQTFPEKVALLKKMIAKVNADGDTGPLVAMLEKKGIDLSVDAANALLAVGYDDDFKSFDKLGQSLHQQIEGLMKPIIANTTGAFQFLKTLFEPNFKAVGDYGATISDSGKFTYPTTTVTWMDLFTAMKEENDSFIAPLVSPLLRYNTENKISLTLNATNGASALAKQTAQEEDVKSSENAREKRDNKFLPIVVHMRTIIRFLMKLYPDNTKELGLYGVTIVLMPKVAKKKSVKLAMGDSKLKAKLIVGSTISNTGEEAINVYKGKTISGTPVAVDAGKKWVVAAGFSIACIQNPSLTNGATYDVLPK